MINRSPLPLSLPARRLSPARRRGPGPALGLLLGLALVLGLAPGDTPALSPQAAAQMPALMEPGAGTEGAETPAPAPDGVRIVAVVNDDVVSALDLEARLNLVVMAAQLPDTEETRARLRPQVLRTLIDEKLQLQEATRLKITVTPKEINDAIANIETDNNIPKGELESFLHERDIPLRTLRTQIEASIAWLKIVRTTLSPLLNISDAEIQDRLERIEAQRGEPEDLVSEIFLPFNRGDEGSASTAAARIVSQLRSGARFDALAEQFSQSATAASGGEIGWITRDQLAPELDAAVAALRPDEYSDPVRTANGYYIFWLQERRDPMAEDQAGALVSLRQLVIPTDGDPEAAIARANALRAGIGDCAAMDRAIAESGSELSGNLGNVSISDMPASIRSTLQSLELGQISPPLPSGDRVLLLMTCDRYERNNPMPDRQSVEDTLTRQRLDLLARQYLRDLRQSAYLDIRA